MAVPTHKEGSRLSRSKALNREGVGADQESRAAAYAHHMICGASGDDRRALSEGASASNLSRCGPADRRAAAGNLGAEPRCGYVNGARARHHCLDR